MTRDLDRSIVFFTDVVGFRLDFAGTLPANGEPFLGSVFNIDASQSIRRALLSTSQEPRGLFLIEHTEAPLAKPRCADDGRDSGRSGGYSGDTESRPKIWRARERNCHRYDA